MAKKIAKKISTGEKSSPTRIKAGDPVPDDVRDLFLKHQKYLSAGKKNYGKADSVLEQLLARIEPGVEITVEAKSGPAMKLTLVDQFAAKNSVWAGSSCKRFKIDESKVKPQDAGKE